MTDREQEAELKAELEGDEIGLTRQKYRELWMELMAARDEIVTLRLRCGDMRFGLEQARADALEEAARECDRIANYPEWQKTDYPIGANDCACAIRWLKDHGNDPTARE